MLPLRIFISYGRDQYAPLAARLAADLTAKGYEDWYDQQLQSGRPWARDIQKQLRWLVEVPENGRFIFFAIWRSHFGTWTQLFFINITLKIVT